MLLSDFCQPFFQVDLEHPDLQKFPKLRSVCQHRGQVPWNDESNPLIMAGWSAGPPPPLTGIHNPLEVTLPETNSSPIKMDGWNTTFLLGFGLFSGAFNVSFREGNSREKYVLIAGPK